MTSAEKFDKTIDAMKLINRNVTYRCGHCGAGFQLRAWREFPKMGLRVVCEACGAKASVRVKPKHTAARVAAAACYALKKQYNKAVAEELMK